MIPGKWGKRANLIQATDDARFLAQTPNPAPADPRGEAPRRQGAEAGAESIEASEPLGAARPARQADAAGTRSTAAAP